MCCKALKPVISICIATDAEMRYKKKMLLEWKNRSGKWKFIRRRGSRERSFRKLHTRNINKLQREWKTCKELSNTARPTRRSSVVQL